MKTKLIASVIPYSGVVGGGVALNDAESGARMFQIAIMGTHNGITKQESDEILKAFVALINDSEVILFAAGIEIMYCDYQCKMDREQ